MADPHHPTTTGRCLCGAVRYAFDGPPNWQDHCHCESCRRATSSAFTSYFAASQGRWRWTAGAPARFGSSPGVMRFFCPVCGSQMAYQSAARPDEIDFHAATLDDPTQFRPTAHDHWDEHLPWLHVDDGLPRNRSPRRLSPDDDMVPVLTLIRDAFACMDGVIDPPSSIHALAVTDLAASARHGEVWVLTEGQDPIACIVLTPRGNSLYLGKIAVSDAFRRQGLARQLVAHAETRARALGLPALELQSRVELTGNHSAFAALGFARTAETAHPGYDRPTSFTFTKAVP
jgi:ribosomal protein S18 acetylase RimI-like enzyme